MNPKWLDEQMAKIADHIDEGPCLEWQGEIDCPCCGGSGEHIGPKPAENAYPCTFCEGMAVVKIQRKRML
ncbi:MAG: hypothetical protein Q7O66_14940 [Dehalococcoidia bacterium]|nr:hypothetical protein [Dehalococcoidia bacterium]